MPVDSVHPEYSTALAKWERCRDCDEGEDAIKAKRELYLPRLSGHTPDPDGNLAYAGYVSRAMFYPAVARTIAGLLGAILRRPPAVQGVDNLKAQLDDVTTAGRSLQGFTIDVLEEVLKVGRAGVLLDMSKGAGSRPYWVRYAAEQIVNWRTRSVKTPDGEKQQPTLIVLKEAVADEALSDKYETKTTTRYRVLELLDGVYTVTLYRQPEGAKEWIVEEAVQPQRRGEKFDEIPFVFIGPHDTDAGVDKPPLLDLVNINLSHYRTSADLETGAHYTAIPTPVATGVTSDKPLRIGPTTAWTLQDPNAKAFFLEFSGQGLGALETRSDKKEAVMAIIGARLLESGPKHEETAEAVRTRHSGERATLTTIALAVSEAFTALLQWHAWWAGSDRPESEISLTLNTEFFEQTLSAQDRQVLLLEWQSAGISKQTYYHNLQRGGVARPDTTFEEEQALIDAESAGAEQDRILPAPEKKPAAKDPADDEEDDDDTD